MNGACVRSVSKDSGAGQIPGWVQIIIIVLVIALVGISVTTIGVAAQSIVAMTKLGDPVPMATPAIQSLAH